MKSQTSLIERAAARLREQGPPGPEASSPVSSSPGASIPDGPAPGPALRPPLERHAILDRDRLAESGIMMPWSSTARIVEEFRVVKRNIMASWEASLSAGRTARVILVTSARPREGKTFSSINLALAFAAEEELVTVLIDADTVRADTAKCLQLPTEPGLTDVLSGKLGLTDALIQSDLSNFVILPPGAPGPHVPELLSGPAPGALIAAIVERYPNHVIIIDTPPCLASTDPIALAPLADQVVFVVEAEHTQRPEVEAALNMLGNCSQISLLLNMTPEGANEHFGSYSYYFNSPKA
jgi:receptor protein-tyrosine kinase